MKSNAPSSNQLNQVIAHLRRAIQHRDGRDVVLLFAGETARMVAFALGLLNSYVRSSRRTPKLVCLSKILPTCSCISSFASSTNQALTCARALTDMLEEWQIMNRLWGVLDMWTAGTDLLERVSRGELGKKSGKGTFAAIEGLQTLFLTSFHICEAASFLSSKKVVNLSPKTQERLTFVAIRFWAAFTMTEIGRLLLDWSRNTQQGSSDVSEEWKKGWKKELLQNMAWAPVTLHWSLRQGLIPEALVSPLAVFATWSLVKDVWQSSA
ncbi:hypothetical protein F66182_7536 [Fusarium sp. NRRL 66182]|nr:hypothetical protein F66182_7536 [Fusarium sp. NRRL 66182]